MDPPSLVEILAERARTVPVSKTDLYNVVDRLKRKFGLGDRPKVRTELYRWLARLADEHGEPVLCVISTAVAQSVSARRPGRYFASAVVRMLRERDYASKPSSEGDASW